MKKILIVILLVMTASLVHIAYDVPWDGPIPPYGQVHVLELDRNH